jgi:CheY-like chemotaxis protein
MPEQALSERHFQLLVCEDNRADVLLVRQAIALYKVPVYIHVTSNGDAAVDFIARAEEGLGAPTPEIVLLDLNLPKRSGSEVLERIRASSKFKNIPVIIFTSSDSPLDKAQTTTLGATRYFLKPATYDEFLKIGEVLKELLPGQEPS